MALYKDPQSECKRWDEIWEKMTEEQLKQFISNICDELKIPIDYYYNSIWIGDVVRIKKAKPDVCWRALIPILEKQ